MPALRAFAATTAWSRMPVANAGRSMPANVLDITDEQWHGVMDLGKAGVRVNALAPGVIDTPMQATNPSYREAVLQRAARGASFRLLSRRTPDRRASRAGVWGGVFRTPEHILGRR